ncbi:CBM35 domain-containing protein [Globicatella sulfidifaciens]|uniref:CBM6 domain-containing protein n=1 Tax=Globicatella sulfidifaciens TaxID=136093 RepID=A0A7X8H138_9LACT|nr:CBM35 domain-containing protein [Globicatella sulfidifaciens]NLJ19499.1 hypothetical protein [Globicatella sulfidifaciens]
MKKLFAFMLMFTLLLVNPIQSLAETIYYAEDATLVGDGVEIGDGDMISGFDDPDTQWIEFNVTVPSSDTYTIELSYATPMENASLLINDHVIETPPAGDWGVDPGTVEFPLDLEDGDNTIVIKRESDYAQIHYLKVLSSDSAEASDNDDEVDANDTEEVDNTEDINEEVDVEDEADTEIANDSESNNSNFILYTILAIIAVIIIIFSINRKKRK